MFEAEEDRSNKSLGLSRNGIWGHRVSETYSSLSPISLVVLRLRKKEKHKATSRSCINTLTYYIINLWHTLTQEVKGLKSMQCNRELVMWITQTWVRIIPNTDYLHLSPKHHPIQKQDIQSRKIFHVKSLFCEQAESSRNDTLIFNDRFILNKT